MKFRSFNCRKFWSTAALFASFVWGAAEADLRAQVIDDSQSAPAENVAPVSAQRGRALMRGVLPLSAQQRDSLLLKERTLREGMAASEKTKAPSPSALPLDNMPESKLAPMVQFPGNPSELVFGRTGQAPESSNPSTGNALAEPVGANVGDQWYVAGNSAWAMFSDDGGQTWTSDDPSQTPPTDAPFACCDQDVILDPASRVFFVETLYTNAARNNGVVRIAVHRNPDAGTDCYYDFRSSLGGNVVPDYPHLGLTKRFLYFSANEVSASAQRAAMYRYDLDAMENCAQASGSVFIWNRSIDGQRVWVPAGGTANGETMYWSHHANSGTLRLFRWNEDTGLISRVDRTVAGSNFDLADCRGGVNNTNWIEPAKVSIAGFTHRTTLTAIRNDANEYHRGILVYWPSGDIGTTRPQAFVRAALFRDGSGGFSLFSQPDIFNSGFCFGDPVATANKRGDVGIALALGGKKGGGGTAVQPAVGIADEFTGGNGFARDYFVTASGTHNPGPESSGIYGDYFTIHANEPCENWFGATGYALNGGTGVANVNEVYVEFGRRQSIQCWNGWIGVLPKPGM